MQITGIADLSSYLIHQAAALTSQQVHRQIQVAVLKQALDQQNAAGEAVVRLINSGPGQNSSAAGVDIRI